MNGKVPHCDDIIYEGVPTMNDVMGIMNDVMG